MCTRHRPKLSLGAWELERAQGHVLEMDEEGTFTASWIASLSEGGTLLNAGIPTACGGGSASDAMAR